MTIRLSIPTQWNDLSDQQMYKVAKTFFSGTSGAKLFVTIFYILLNIPWYRIDRIKRAWLVVRQVPVTNLKSYFEYLFTTAGPTRFPKSFKIKGFLYHPPHDKITNISVEEFAIADDLYLKFHKTHDMEYLQYLASVLYVANGKNVRPHFIKANLHDMATVFKKVPQKKLLAIYLSYQGCRDVLTNKYRYVFPKSNVLSKKKKGSSYGFSKVILGMAGKSFGDHEKTRYTNVYTFMEQFNTELKAARDAKSKSRKS